MDKQKRAVTNEKRILCKFTLTLNRAEEAA